jgi:8-oxo-dGTP pyrophosphatase MutT (NUDIX family)
MSRTYSFCSNCGENGHMFHQCKKPITSNGVIAYTFKESQEPKYLMICRKDSLGFVDFMRGKYILHDKQYIQNIVDEMTVSEKQKLLTHTFDELWVQLWGGNIGIQYRGEEKTSRDKFNKLKHGIMVRDTRYTLSSIISNTSTCWDEPEWGFPKGRRNYNEKEISCALREFEEETGYCGLNLHLIQNLLPFEEVFTGSNNKSYKHCYYIANMNHHIDNEPDYQKSEVSKIKWFCYHDAINIMRPYNLEKKEILDRVNTLIKEYRISTDIL